MRLGMQIVQIFRTSLLNRKYPRTLFICAQLYRHFTMALRSKSYISIISQPYSQAHFQSWHKPYEASVSWMGLAHWLFFRIHEITKDSWRLQLLIIRLCGNMSITSSAAKKFINLKKACYTGTDGKASKAVKINSPASLPHTGRGHGEVEAMRTNVRPMIHIHGMAGLLCMTLPSYLQSWSRERSGRLNFVKSSLISHTVPGGVWHPWKRLSSRHDLRIKTCQTFAGEGSGSILIIFNWEW